MVNYISLYPNPYEDSFNDEIILAPQDRSIESYIITEMKELEAIENIYIEQIQVIYDHDEIDLNQYMVNINYKKKDMASIEIPKYKFINSGRYGEVVFTIRVHTNLNSKTIVKRILFPVMHNGFFENGGKKMQSVWQIVDEATYSQRGKNTMKSRMPVIIYQNKHREIVDVLGNTFVAPSYSYALNGKKRRGPVSTTKKPKTKFINPLMIYSAKMGFHNTIEFFGMDGIVFVDEIYKDSELEHNYIFPLDEVYLKVSKKLYNKYELVRSFICMAYNLKSPRDFPVNLECLDDRTYWTCRIGTVGAARNKQIMSFYEKGVTNIYMIERLLNEVTKESLRLEEYYKHNIYFIIYWMITNFSELRKYSNTDMRNKRIRRNEVLVNASLGKKISENINKLIERMGKSKMNNMDTLLELFNFSSDIVIMGMRNLNDIIKSDDIVNDLDFLVSTSFTVKGPNSLGDGNSKMIALKYRYIDPSMVGVLDLNVSSNSDIGMSGSFVPWAKLYDGFYFTPEHQPCETRFNFEKSLQEEEGFHRIPLPLNSFDDYVKFLNDGDKFKDLLRYEKIEIVEKTPEELARKSRHQTLDSNTEERLEENDSGTENDENYREESSEVDIGYDISALS